MTIPDAAVEAAAKQIVAHLASEESGYVDAEDMSDVVIDVRWFDLTSAIRDALGSAFPYLTVATRPPVTDWPDIPRSHP